ncbi:MAG: hypothetical protein AAB951_01265 [Patescibacteria group bacterium]
MTIAKVREKCKSALDRVPRDVLTIGILILASLASFWLGYLAGLDAGRFESEGKGSGVLLEAPATSSTVSPEWVVASKNGTKYYMPNCSGADRISDANKVWFASASAAQASGYALATTCKSP